MHLTATSVTFFWAASAVLLAGAALFLLIPLWRHRRGVSRGMVLLPLLLLPLMCVGAYFLYDRWGYLDEVRLMQPFQRSLDNEDDPEEAAALLRELGPWLEPGRAPDNPWLWFFLGRNFLLLGEIELAARAFEESAALLPDGAEKDIVLQHQAAVAAALQDGAQDEVQDKAQDKDRSEISSQTQNGAQP